VVPRVSEVREKMATRTPYVPGEQTQETLGGDVIFTQTPGSSSGDSGYTGEPDNPANLRPSGSDVGRDVGPSIFERDVQVPSLSSVRPPGERISSSEIGQGATDYYAQQNSLISAEQVDVRALSSQYDSLIQQLQGSYALAETEEEKQRLRYMLADIEAQYDAAKESIQVTYQAERELLARRIEDEKIYGQDYAQRAGQTFETLADQSESRLGQVAADRQQQFRGLGIEAADKVTNEWTETLRGLGAIQTSYLAEVGNNRVATMNRSLDSMVMQELAQKADLERLKAQTTSAGQFKYLQEVGDRVNRERVAMREDFTRITMTKIAATQSALEFNASMRDRAASRIQQEPDPAARYDAFLQYSTAQGAMLVDPEEFERQFRATSRGEAPDDSMWYNFLSEGEKAARGEFNIASKAYTDYYTMLESNGFSPTRPSANLDAVFARVVMNQLEALRRDRDESYEVYQTYESLLAEINRGRE